VSPSPLFSTGVVQTTQNSITDDVYPEWRRLVVTHGVSGKKAHDARLVAAMTVNRITHILTFNADDFARYTGINVIDPARL